MRAGYEVHLVISAPRSEVKEGVHIHPIPKPRCRVMRMLFGPWIALHAALKTKANLYHYHDPELIGMGFVLRRLLGKKVVFDIHECVHRQLLSKHYLPRWAGWLIGWVYRGLERVLTLGQTKVVANAHQVQDYRDGILVQNYPLLETRVIPKERCFGENGVPALVYLGNVSAIRGAFTYIELADQLQQRGYPFTMTLIGEHPQAFGEELQALIQARGLAECVTVTGRLDWYAAMQIVSRATIGLCLLEPVPNYTSCLATKILEYMMVGTPVLASNFDVWRPFVEGEGVGFMVDPTHLDEVVTTCERLLSDTTTLGDMSRRAQRVVAEKYNWKREFMKLLACYEKLLR